MGNTQQPVYQALADHQRVTPLKIAGIMDTEAEEFPGMDYEAPGLGGDLYFPL